MKPIEELLQRKEIKKEAPRFKNRRDELICRLTEGINKLREGTKYKPVTTRFMAIKVNQNPFLKSDDELELEIKNCESKGSYAHLFWLIKQ